MDDFKIKNWLKARALALAIDIIARRPTPERDRLDELHRIVVADAWTILSWASSPNERHAPYVEEGIARRTTELLLDRPIEALLAGRAQAVDPSRVIWAAILDNLHRGPFSGPCPVVEHATRRDLAIAFPSAVVSYDAARLGLLPQASLAGALRMATKTASADVRHAQARLTASVTVEIPAAQAAYEALFAPVRAFALRIDACVMARELVAAFPAAECLIEDRRPKTAAIDADASALLRDLA